MALAISLYCLFCKRAQMLVDDGHGVGKNLAAVAVAVLVQRQLRLVIAQLVEQAIAQIAAGDAGRIQLADQLQGFVQIGGS